MSDLERARIREQRQQDLRRMTPVKPRLKLVQRASDDDAPIIKPDVPTVEDRGRTVIYTHDERPFVRKVGF